MAVQKNDPAPAFDLQSPYRPSGSRRTRYFAPFGGPIQAMRLSLRFVLPLLLAIGLVAYAVRPLVDQLTLKWFVRDLDIRAMLIVNTLQEPVGELVHSNARTKLSALFNRIAQDERLYAVGFCDPQRHQVVGTRAFPADVTCDNLDRFADENPHVLGTPKGPLHIVVAPVRADGEDIGRLVIV